MITLEEYSKINNLINSCDELIAGKFILSEYKISKILKDIGESQEVYKLLSSCMQNFNFEREFSRAQISLPRKKFVLPQEPEKLLPFVFCLLVDLNKGKINLNAFLNTYYKDEEGTDAFAKFVSETIKPFRNIIKQYFDEEDEPKKEQNPEPIQEVLQPEVQEETADESELDNFFKDCKTICNEILSELRFERKREKVDDVEYILNTMITACEDKNFKYLSALITAFTYLSENLKSIRFLSRELRNILINFVEGL